eukprot:6760-Heterococcus_DN1.PRE.4
MHNNAAVEVPCDDTNDKVECTPYVERAVYLMLHDKELQRLDPERTIAARYWALPTVEFV